MDTKPLTEERDHSNDSDASQASPAGRKESRRLRALTSGTEVISDALATPATLVHASSSNQILLGTYRTRFRDEPVFRPRVGAERQTCR
jgi:hypothetical protein